MSQIVLGLFSDSKNAGEAISELKNQGFTKDISVITKKGEDDVASHDIKKDTSDGAGAGAATGAAIGGVAAGVTALLAGAASFVVPGAGLIVLGPLGATLAGAAAGAATGGIVGALVDAGVPDERAKTFENQVMAGDTLVYVTVPDARVEEARLVYDKNAATSVEVLKQKE